MYDYVLLLSVRRRSLSPRAGGLAFGWDVDYVRITVEKIYFADIK